MKVQVQLVKTTVLGGIVFLVPIVVIVAILGKAFEIMKHVAMPISRLVPVESFAGIAMVNLVAVIVILAICFLAGISAKTALAGKLVDVLESYILSNIPMYAVIKGMTASVAGAEELSELKPVLARFDDYWQIVFEIERIEGGSVAVYLPGAPNPWSGSVCVITDDRIRPLDASMVNVVQNFRHLGRGSNELLRDYLPKSAA